MHGDLYFVCLCDRSVSDLIQQCVRVARDTVNVRGRDAGCTSGDSGSLAFQTSFAERKRVFVLEKEQVYAAFLCVVSGPRDR